VSLPTASALPSPGRTATTAIAPAPTATRPTPIPTRAPSPPPPTAAPPSVPGVPAYTYAVVHVYPHDRGAFTEGLVFQDGVFYESTGLRGSSSLRRVALESGEILQFRALSPQFFGEGIALWGPKIVQLTWQSHIGFVYDKDSFELLSTFHDPTEGWGLTQDGSRLIMSDGTATLHFLDPESLAETGEIDVYDDRGPVVNLNELEYVKGEIYANVWQTDRIARIDPQTGQVTGWIDLTGLLSAEDQNPPVDVLNGIAYDAENDRLFVTGKLWPKLFEIELIAQPGPGA
jgi:glutamine cyclotransferase